MTERKKNKNFCQLSHFPKTKQNHGGQRDPIVAIGADVSPPKKLRGEHGLQIPPQSDNQQMLHLHLRRNRNPQHKPMVRLQTQTQKEI